MFDSSGTFVKSLYCDLRKVDGELLDKADIVFSFVEKMQEEMFGEHIKVGYGTDVHFIEDKLAGFSGGGSNAGTIMRLAAFNFAVSWMIWDKLARPSGGLVQHIHPSTVKAIMKKEGLVVPKGGDKKELTLNWVRSKEPSFKVELNRNDNPQPYMYDMADAYITAYAGRRKYPDLCK